MCAGLIPIDEFVFRPRLRLDIDNGSKEYAVLRAIYSLEADGVRGIEEPGRLPALSLWMRLVCVDRFQSNRWTDRHTRSLQLRVQLDDSGYPVLDERIRLSPRGKKIRLVNLDRLRIAGRKAAIAFLAESR